MKTKLSPLQIERGFKRCGHCGLIAKPDHMRRAEYDQSVFLCKDTEGCERRWYRGLCGEGDDQ